LGRAEQKLLAWRMVMNATKETETNGTSNDWLLEHYPLSNLYLKQRFGDRILPPSSGKKPTQFGRIDN
jgi:hypothetical protein